MLPGRLYSQVFTTPVVIAPLGAAKKPIAGAIQIQTTRRRTLRGGVDDGLKTHWRPQLYVQTLTVAATGVVVRVYIQQFQGTSQVFWIFLACRVYTVFWMRTRGNAKSRNLRKHSVHFLVCIGDVRWGHFGSFSCTLRWRLNFEKNGWSVGANVRMTKRWYL